MTHRLAGIVCPISALPSRWGIGDFGRAAYDFVDWLEAAGQSYWQVLPLTIPDSVGSPYASPSSLAGSWLYLSPESLVQAGLLPAAVVPRRPASSPPVLYRRSAAKKKKLLWQSFVVFEQIASPSTLRRYARFVEKNQSWLPDFTLFYALKDRHQGRPWWQWPKKFQHPATARRALDSRLVRRQMFQAYLQWIFSEQWGELKTYAHRHGVRILGDLPFYVQRDSVEVWSHPELFLLDRRRQPQVVAGTPPDNFNPDGQRWGNPVYRWSAHRRTKFSWWTERLAVSLQRFDLVRVDHFRGLVATWHFPARVKSTRGRWVASPGRELLRTWQKRWPRLPIVAEDLGLSSPAVTTLRRAFRIDCVRVFVFAWNGLPDNFHHPDHLVPDSWYYSSIHDSNTMIGWWRDEAKRYERQHLRDYLGRTTADLTWSAIAAVYRNREHVAMIPVQDVLGLGSTGRFNRPGQERGNWRWRLGPKALTQSMAKKLNRLVHHA